MSELLLVIFLDEVCIQSYSPSHLLSSATSSDNYHVIVIVLHTTTSTLLLLSFAFQVAQICKGFCAAALCKKEQLVKKFAIKCNETFVI